MFLKAKFGVIFIFMLMFITSPVMQQNNRTFYVLVEKSSSAAQISTEDANTDSNQASSEPSLEQGAYVISFRGTDTVGLIFPHDAKITIYTNHSLVAEVYNISTDAETGSYRLLSNSPSVTTTANDQTRNNNGLMSRHQHLAHINTDGLLATSSVDVLEADNILVIGQPVSQPSHSIKGVISMDLGQVAFQIIQIGNRVIEFGIPSLAEPTSFTLIANKDLNLIELVTLSSGSEVPQSTSQSHSRDVFVELLGQPHEHLFSRMRELNIRIYPLAGMSFTYNPERILRVEMAQEDAVRREFLRGTFVRPLIGSRPQLRLRDGNVYGEGILKNDAEVQGVEDGKLIIKQQGAQADEIVEAWLVDVVSN